VLGPGELLLQVSCCGVCRTDLHLAEGDLPPHRPRCVPGHEVIGRVVGHGPGAGAFAEGERVGVAWLRSTCGRCRFCATGRENLCLAPAFTGWDADGGYAQLTTVPEAFAHRIPESFDDVSAAPLLCAGLIGHRAYRLATEHPFGGDASRLGLYGFGAAAHLLAQVAVADGRRVYAFTRPGDSVAQAHARALGATWAGGSDEASPEPLDAALLFAPVGALVPAALRAVRPGGVVVCAGIHMTDVPGFPYALLWRERSVRSVANLTRADATSFLRRAASLALRVDTVRYPLDDANTALADLRAGRLVGAAVLIPPPPG
jgi:propanol-preferring alcohol dehydrogenase